jgi:hypothetical protein
MLKMVYSIICELYLTLSETFFNLFNNLEKKIITKFSKKEREKLIITYLMKNNTKCNKSILYIYFRVFFFLFQFYLSDRKILFAHLSGVIMRFIYSFKKGLVV